MSEGTALPSAPASSTVGGAALSRAHAMTGPQKALLFLLSLDEQVATGLLARLSEDDVRRLRSVTDSLGDVDPGVLSMVHREFAEEAAQGMPLSMKESSAYLRRLAGKALGEGRVADLWAPKRIIEHSVKAIAHLEPATIIGLVEPEQDQTIAVVLSHFDSDKAAAVLALLPVERQAQVVNRMLKLEKVPTSVIREIEAQFAAEIEAFAADDEKAIPGVDVAAGLLKQLPQGTTDAVLESVAATDPDAATKLRKALFTFEDLIRIEGRGMQVFLQEIATAQLVVALKTASEELRQKIFGNLSSRAAASLKEEIAMLGTVRLSDVETAQQALVETAMQLEKDGRIQIAREGGGGYV